MPKYLSLVVATTFVGTFCSDAAASPVTVYSDRTVFETATAATALPLPSWSDVFTLSCGSPFGQTGAGPSVSIPFGINSVTVTDPATGGLCIFDNGAVLPAANTDPTVMIANTIVGNGEDDYLLAFSQPVWAVGFRLLTNNMASESVTLRDASNALIATVDVDALTGTNTRQFLGFLSTVPIGSVFIDTQGGAVQNEGFDFLEVGSPTPIPEPATVMLLGAGLAAASVRRSTRRLGRRSRQRS